MPSLKLLLLAALVSVLWATWRRLTNPASKFEAVAFLVMWCLTLGLALRFGGRTYPGIWFPDSALLNGIFNGVWLFTEVGYDAVALCFVAGLVLIVLPAENRATTFLKAISWLGIITATIIAIYGFYWAAVLGRLP